MNRIITFFILATILFSLCGINTLAETNPIDSKKLGTVYGTVTNIKTGEFLYGINVVLSGTSFGAATDMAGTFTIQNVPQGVYEIKISGIGYISQVIKGVAIANDKPVVLNIVLQDEVYQTEEIVVSSDMIRSTEASMLSERKRSGEIRDVISAEQIRRSPDATSSDALKRVTGLNVVDNKFVYIRGITDRYNGTMLDGASVASTEMGKKSFSFDLLPANLLENVSVIKSVTPDLPGDFSGGLVKLNTLDFPTERTIRATIGSSFNSRTTFKNIELSSASATDWMGFDDGSRALPEHFSNSTELAKNLKNNWAPRGTQAPTNSSFSLVYGDRLFTNDDTQDQLGYILALTYKNGFQRNEKIINDNAVGRFSTGANDEYSVLWGLLSNVSYKFGGTNKISFKNNFNQSSADELAKYNSNDSANGQNNKYTISDWTQRSIYSGQLSGEHTLTDLGKINLNWKAAVSSSKRENPDRKEITYYRDLYDDNQQYTAAVNQRSWAKMNDRSYTLSTDLTYPIKEAKVKIGTHYETKETSYKIRYFNIVPDYFGGIPEDMTHLPIDQIYAPENFGSGKFLLNESSKASDSYLGEQTLWATYAMLDLPFTLSDANFRFTGGVRMEKVNQFVSVPKSLVAGGPTTDTYKFNEDYLPSFNLAYNITPTTNFRIAYSHSVNRPDFRELAATGFFDFIKYEMVGGNPNLNRALVKGFDVRFETFPHPDEVFAMSFFRRNITDAIEERLEQTATRTRTWFNSEKASNTGIEIEARKSLGFISNELQNFSVTGNYTRVWSEVEVKQTIGNSSKTEEIISTRPLQGQSSYTINLTLMYNNPQSGTSISLLYNRFGERLETVGFLTADIYEDPRDLIDFSLSQQLTSLLEMKLAIKNLGNVDKVLVRDGESYLRTTGGITYSLQFAVRL